ncbi:hypothetical protein PP175_12915 [Aneurinibacillus sp. Ricciae_BoGa-3]|uniref:hypothetical protein n=1 Tax=Aneurinibacillus sp. Ricciae_BoGa-3 TaxID=3022697 RepID=UPI0023421272|nr:hypothetical protein [Aneurinibacillus sp. Ricciae_BoGa-3]WCK52362.1 hypothetical protein PP175_12915 [Aneurinibacillus sp. Ricciae_BoGa-3]
MSYMKVALSGVFAIGIIAPTTIISSLPAHAAVLKPATKIQLTKLETEYLNWIQ